jgi:hypothetical protein
MGLSGYFFIKALSGSGSLFSPSKDKTPRENSAYSV